MSSKSKEVYFNNELFEAAIKDPAKRALILQLIHQEKDAIEEYKKANKWNEASPLKKLKSKVECNSPTALLRKRALEKRTKDNGDTDSASECSSSSKTSDLEPPLASTPIPFENILKGVVAFVEIKSKDQDRSDGAKLFMTSMGAKVRDNFTRDVTHVVFKDGSYTTYQKAKLMKVHLVSVLWLEAVRRSGFKVPEKNYPALGVEAADHNVTNICSQMQREYEDVVREEVRRSIACGIPLPTTKDLLKNGRRSLMTPIPFNSSYYSQSQKSNSSKNLTPDEEVAKINSSYNRRKTVGPLVQTQQSPNITDDDSSCGMVNGEFSGMIEDSNMDLTCEGSLSNNRSKENDSQSLVSSKFIATRRRSLRTPIKTPLNSEKRSKESFETPDLSTESLEIINEIPSDLPSISQTLQKSTPQFIKPQTSIKSTKTPRQSAIKTTNKNESAQKLMTSFVTQEPKIATPINNNNVTVRTPRKSNKTQENFVTPRRITRQSIRLTNTNQQEQEINKNTKSRVSFGNNSILTDDDDLTKSGLEERSNSNSKILDKPSGTAKNDDPMEHDKENENRNSLEKRTSTNSSLPLQESSTNSPRPKKTGSQTKKNSMNSTTSNMSPLQMSKGSKMATTVDTIDTNMSSLQITNDSSINKNQRTSVSTTMSSLRFSTNSKESKEMSNNVDDSLFPIKKATFVTKRKAYSTQKVSEGSFSSLDSGTMSNIMGALDSKNNSKEIIEDTCSPPKQPKIQTNDTNNQKKCTSTSEDSSPTKKGEKVQKTKRYRKLYNPDQLQNEVFGIMALPEEEERKINRELKKKHEPIIIHSSIIFTDNAKKILEQQNAKVATKAMTDSSDDDLIKPRNKTTSKKKTTKKKTPEVTHNPEKDEQTDLAAEFVFKTPQKSPLKTKNQLRRSVRLTSQTLDSSSSTENSDIFTQLLYNRRSTLDFQPKTPSSSVKKLKKITKPTICCTKMHNSEVQMFQTVVRKLGKFEARDEVTATTTHLVIGEAKRTINMLRAISRGCWILSQEWLLKSLEENKWLPEEPYEVEDFSPAVKKCRIERQAFGPTYTLDIFRNSGAIYVSKSSTPRCSDLVELITTCKGKTTKNILNSNIVVGEYMPNKTCVTEKWILDCITFCRLKNIKSYLIKNYINERR